MIHYVLPEGPSAGQCRPGVIVRVWNQETGMSNLNVHLDGSNDGGGSLLMAAPSVSYAKGAPSSTGVGSAHSWHWSTECGETGDSQEIEPTDGEALATSDHTDGAQAEGIADGNL